jgi:hypothetical protein
MSKWETNENAWNDEIDESKNPDSISIVQQ